MALVIGPLGGSAASGKMGGQVFARNRAGQYSRAWAKPVNPGSIRQTAVRGQFGTSSSHWGMLTQAQIDSWNAYAATLTRLNRLGQPYTPKGRQIYMEVNNNLQQAVLAMIDEPSAVSDNPAITKVNIGVLTETAGVIDAATLTALEFTIPSGADGVVIVEATPPHDPKLTNVNNLFRQIQVAPGPSPLATIDVEAAYIALFGPSGLAGQQIDFRARVVDDTSGLGSSWLKVQGTLS